MQAVLDDLKLIADKLARDFEFYRKKKIFITGGTGFFGKWLLETFIYLNENHSLNVSLTILSRSPEKFKKNCPHLFSHENFRFIQGDVRHLQDLEEDFDLIIHAATDASAELNRSNPELMRSTIMEGTKKICDFAKKVKCKRILYTSSGAAYGPQPENLTHMPETFVNNPLFDHNDAYASAKLESENYFKVNAPCDIVIARCFAFAGPYLPLNGSYAFGNFIDDVLNDRDIEIQGDGTAMRSYLYAADLVVWLLRILSLGKPSEVYNVGSPYHIDIATLANEISLNKVSVSILSNGYGKKYVPCVEKAKKELNLDIYTSLQQSIIKTFKFHTNP